MRRMFALRRPSPGFFVSVAALVLALGAGSVAVGSLNQAANGAKRLDFHGTATDAAPGSPPNTPGAHRVLKVDEVVIKASCVNAGGTDARLYVTLASTKQADFNWSYIRWDNPGFTPLSNGSGFGSGGGTYSFVDISGTNRNVNGQLTYRTGSRTITFTFVAVADGNYLGNRSCRLQGTALPAPN